MNIADVNAPLYQMDAPALYQLAIHYENKSVALKAMAEKLMQRDDYKDRNTRELAFYKRLPDTVRKFMKQGHPIEIALDLAAGHAGVKYKTVQTYWQKYVTSKDKADIARKHDDCISLFSVGFTNAQIGRALNYHPNHVSRVRSEMRKLEQFAARMAQE